jgi:hypothetical protein
MGFMIKVIKAISVTIFIAQGLISCKPKIDGQEHFRALEEVEGLRKTVTAGGIIYTFQFGTAEAIAWKEIYDPETRKVYKVQYKKRLEELKGFIYVFIYQKVADRNISVLKFNAASNAEYEGRVKYYEFNAGSDMRMLCNGMEYPPSSYQYENRMDLSPANTLIAAFPACDQSKEWQIVFNDRIMNNLLLKANFNKQDIEALPPLEIN